MDELFENVGKVVQNKAHTPGGPCEKVLGNNGLLLEAAEISVRHAELFALIGASAVLEYSLGSGRSSQEIDAFKQGVGAFTEFLVKSYQEVAQKKQQPTKSS